MGHARVPCGQHREGWRFAAAGQGGSVFPAEAGSPVECAGASTHQGDDAAQVGKKVGFGIGKLKAGSKVDGRPAPAMGETAWLYRCLALQLVPSWTSSERTFEQCSP